MACSIVSELAVSVRTVRLQCGGMPAPAAALLLPSSPLLAAAPSLAAGDAGGLPGFMMGDGSGDTLGGDDPALASSGSICSGDVEVARATASAVSWLPEPVVALPLLLLRPESRNDGMRRAAAPAADAAACSGLAGAAATTEGKKKKARSVRG